MTVTRHQPTDFNALRAQLEQADGPTYWRSLEALAARSDFGAFLRHQYPRLAPVWEQSTDRRSVLKLMAASMALAGVSACGGQPGEQIVPYVNMPENLVPGRPRFYATTALVDGYAHGVIAQSNEGRPTKLEGNPDHPATHGALDAVAQASVLSLYDPDRSQAVLENGHIAGFGAFLTGLATAREQWDDNAGAGLCLLTGTVTSPSVALAIDGLRQRWPELRWFTHDALARDNVLAGAELAFGAALEPRYDFSAAQVVLSLDADFMAGEPGALHHARDFMAGRRPTPDNPAMSRLYAIESTPSVTASVADHRQTVAADRILGAARQLAAALGLDGIDSHDNVIDPAWINALARDLDNHRGAALVVAGPAQPPALHALVHAINQQLAAMGRTLTMQQPAAASHRAEPLTALARAIDAGEVDTLAIMDCNPVYDAPADLDFARRLRQVPRRLHWGEYVDETARLAHWHVPAAHALESWGDARAFDGQISLLQPLIEPLHAGRTALQFLHGLGEGTDAGARELLQQAWRQREDFDSGWARWLQLGVVPDTASAALTTNVSRELPAAATAADAAKPDGLLLQFVGDATLRDGRHANNGWLQELPRPITKLTWNNAALVSPALAEKRDLATGDIVRLTLEERALELPAFVLPGQPDDAVTVALGYGREAAGRVGSGVGVNAARLRRSDAPWFVRGLTLAKTGRRQLLATTQDHHAMEGRDLIRAADLATFTHNPDFAKREAPSESLYPEPWPRGEPAEHQWGMSIDLNSCIGCNACVAACQAENNIPVVGEQEVARGHDMHWIRIDRYFEGDPAAPRMVHQPVPCMHCENAPCEYVCPVEATQHSSEGLNEMVYNRCVGTRYCSQNCPYKVRRFNWFDYTGQDTAFHPTPDAVHNPNVTVRSRGVMEKCTYCVQRIKRAEIEADATDLPIKDGDIVTACQQACPTEAIVFGDIADPDSAVSQAKASPLRYGLLENLNTRPRTTYLAAVRNPNPEIGHEGGGSGPSPQPSPPGAEQASRGERSEWGKG